MFWVFYFLSKINTSNLKDEMATDDLNLRITSSEKLETIISTIENFQNLKNNKNEIFIKLCDECKKLDDSYKSISERFDYWTVTLNDCKTSGDTTAEYNFTNRTTANVFLTILRGAFLSFLDNYNMYEKGIEELCNGKEASGILNESEKIEILSLLKNKQEKIKKWKDEMDKVHNFLNPDSNNPNARVIPFI